MGGHTATPEAVIVGELAGLRELSQRNPSIRLYVFGSAVYGPEAPIDLDVLVVYEALDDYKAFQAELDRLAIAPVVDLVAMTPTELSGSGFLIRSRALALDDVDLLHILDVTSRAPAGAAPPE